jgi:hypothetical protein
MRTIKPLFASIVAVALLAGCSGEAPRATKPNPIASELHKELVKHTNYDAWQVDLQMDTVKMTVTVIDSNLLAASHPDRDADAARIADVVEKRIAASPGLAGIQAIHVDYVARSERGALSVKDSMDFRRSSTGRFLPDLS